MEHLKNGTKILDGRDDRLESRISLDPGGYRDEGLVIIFRSRERSDL